MMYQLLKIQSLFGNILFVIMSLIFLAGSNKIDKIKSDYYVGDTKLSSKEVTKLRKQYIDSSNEDDIPIFLITEDLVRHITRKPPTFNHSINSNSKAVTIYQNVQYTVPNTTDSFRNRITRPKKNKTRSKYIKSLYSF
ncbi:unnamed protein product [Gordionus sp. m RMFG-2023]